MTSPDSVRYPGDGDDGCSRSVDMTPKLHEQQDERPNEEYDDEGNVVKVENLEFVSGILGQGSFGIVRLARRRNPTLSSFHPSCSTESGSGTATTTATAMNAFSTPEKPFRSSRRSYSFDEPGESGTGRYTAYRNDFVARARGFGLFRSKSNNFAEATAIDKDNNNDNDQLVAVKICSKSNLKRRRTIERDKTTKRVKVKTALQQVEREIALMKKLSHPNLVPLYEVIDSPETDNLYMVLEYMPLGEILTFREEDGTFQRSEGLKHRQIDGLVDGKHYFDEEHAALYIVDILHGLAYLHQHRICHRDLKPENILLSEKGIAKVGDFGVSHIFEEENVENDSRRLLLSSIDEERRLSGRQEETTASEEADENPFFLTRHNSDSAYDMGRMAGSGILTKTEGTWCFWSPEMCSGSNSAGFSGYAADMWAVGVCLYIFVTGRLPFYTTVPLDLFEMIANCDENAQHFSGLDHLSDPLIDLLRSCLEKDPNKRAGVGDCLHHPFLEKAREQRIRQLGPEFELSKRAILHISEDDIRTAFRTVTSVPVQVLRSASKKIQEGLAHTRDNLIGRMPSLASTTISGDTESLVDRNIRSLNETSDDPKRSTTTNNHRKQNNHVVFYSRQTSGDSGQSESGDNYAYQLTLHKTELESSETDTHVSRLSSGISFGSTVTDDFHYCKEFTSRVSFGSNNTDELPMILSEEDDNRTLSMDNDENDNHIHRHNNPSLQDTEGEGPDRKQFPVYDSVVDGLQETSFVTEKMKKKKASSLQSDAEEVSNEGRKLEHERIPAIPHSGCLIQ